MIGYESQVEMCYCKWHGTRDGRQSDLNKRLNARGRAEHEQSWMNKQGTVIITVNTPK